MSVMTTLLRAGGGQPGPRPADAARHSKLASVLTVPAGH
jgi:hypothetical protein